MKVVPTSLPGVIALEPAVFRDDRGLFFEAWRQEAYAAAGIDRPFVQDNVSVSRRGVLRGLHFQNPVPQGKLVSVMLGEVFDVAVDLRADQPTFGTWTGVSLSGENRRQLFIPEGFAHGFVVLSDSAIVHYKCTAPWQGEYDRSLRWDDPAIGIEWPVADPILSPKDAAAPRLDEIPRSLLYSASGGALPA